MKRTTCLCMGFLLAMITLSCQKNFNHYRELAYGKWELVSVNGESPVAAEQLYFKTSTSVTLTREGVSYEGQYQFYCNVLTTYFEQYQNLFQEWRVQTMKDSLMRAVVEFREMNSDTLDAGSVLEYRKIP
ncbi:MAG TPA: hypothetical protein PKY83_02035 [Bacteroidales bacterium]|nr:hypothetical protein [Bacteroidales bacterium]MCZ2417421.1 hypothetical protein [Burkholderiales bacterium]OQC57461.1 MAG: hypothetical protein BWX52_00962 [Bacteroidetes bacterium ADurb.Bin013]MBP8999272.1 hypothetical protein [Bacteroidales bacterium]MBV6455432.1 hypothetical protein [Bacteroidales bacterium]